MTSTRPHTVRRRAAGLLSATLALGAALLGMAGCNSANPTPQTSRATSCSAGYPAPRRPVGDIVAPRWSDERIRDRQGEATRVFAHLELTPGMAVADIGAGDGYYVARLSPVLGDSGVMYGQDVRDDCLDLLRNRAQRAG